MSLQLLKTLFSAELFPTSANMILQNSKMNEFNYCKATNLELFLTAERQLQKGFSRQMNQTLIFKDFQDESYKWKKCSLALMDLSFWH